MPIAVSAQARLAVNPLSFTIGPGDEKYITAKEIARSGGQPAVLGGSCIEHRYLRERSSYQDATQRVLEVRVSRTKTAPLGNGKCNIIIALRGQHGWSDQTTVRVTLTK